MVNSVNLSVKRIPLSDKEELVIEYTPRGASTYVSPDPFDQDDTDRNIALDVFYTFALESANSQMLDDQGIREVLVNVWGVISSRYLD